MDSAEIDLGSQIKKYESISETLLAMMIVGCFWGEEKHRYLWVKCLERVANPPIKRAGIYDQTITPTYFGHFLAAE